METDQIHLPRSPNEEDIRPQAARVADPHDVPADRHHPTEPTSPRPAEGEGHGRSRRRLLAVYAIGALLLVSSVVAACWLHAQLGRTNASLTSTRLELRRAIERVATARAELATVSTQSEVAGRTLGTESAQLAADQQQLTAAEANVHAKGVSIADLDTCLSGVERALNQISLGNQSAAATTLSSVSTSCQSAQPSG
jgi:hypothetical protein